MSHHEPCLNNRQIFQLIIIRQLCSTMFLRQILKWKCLNSNLVNSNFEWTAAGVRDGEWKWKASVARVRGEVEEVRERKVQRNSKMPLLIILIIQLSRSTVCSLDVLINWTPLFSPFCRPARVAALLLREALSRTWRSVWSLNKLKN